MVDFPGETYRLMLISDDSNECRLKVHFDIHTNRKGALRLKRIIRDHKRLHADNGGVRLRLFRKKTSSDWIKKGGWICGDLYGDVVELRKKFYVFWLS